MEIQEVQSGMDRQNPLHRSEKHAFIDTLPSIINSLAKSRTVKELMFKSVEAVQLFGFERVRLYLLSEDGHSFIGVAQKGMDVDFNRFAMQIRGDDLLEALNGRSTTFIKKRDGKLPEPYEDALGKEGVDAFIYMPLTWQKELIGLVVADNKYSHRPIQPIEIAPLNILSSQIVAMLRTLKEKKDRLSAEWIAKKYGALQRVFTAISSKSTLNDIFNLTCHAAHDLFDIDHVGMVQFEVNHTQASVVAEFPALGTKGITIPVSAVEFEAKLLHDQELVIIRQVEDVKELGPLKEIWRKFDIQSTLIVPILVDETVIGSFSLDMIGHKRPFKKEEIELSKLFAAQIGVAIHNSNLLKEAKQQNKQLTTFSQTTFALTSKNDLNSLFQEIIKQAVDLLEGRSGGIKLFYPEKGVLEVTSVYGRPQSLVGHKIPIGEGMSGALLAERAPYKIINNYCEWPGKLEHYNNDEIVTESIIMAAMQWQEQTVGLLYVEDSIVHKFTYSDAQKLKILADQAAIALKNAQLLNKNRERANRLQQLAASINEIMQDLHSMKLERRLHLIAKHATKILNAEACGISLITPGGKRLKFQAGYGYKSTDLLNTLTFAITDKPRSGLSGYIAHHQKLFNQSGKKLNSHSARNCKIPPQTRSGQCYSLLAIPLLQQEGSRSDLIGLLRVENKIGDNGKPEKFESFSAEDELLLQLFADAVVVAVSTSQFVAKLQENTNHFKQLLDVSPNGVIENGEKGEITYINQKASELLQYDQTEIIGSQVKEIFTDPLEANRVANALNQSGQNLIKGYETALKGKYDSSIPIKLAATRLLSEEGRGGTIGYFEDLREIQEARARTDLLLTATKVLANASELEEGLNQLAKMMVANWGTSFCRICLLDDEGLYLKLTAVQTYKNLPNEGANRSINQITAVSDWPYMDIVLSKLEYHVLKYDDPGTAPMLRHYSQHIKSDPLHSLLVVPIKTRHLDSLGIMLLGNLQDVSQPDISEFQITLAVAIAKQTAVLIERAQLLKKTIRREHLLDHLNNGLQKIRVEKERTVLLHEACRLAASLSDRSIGGLFTNNSFKGELVLEAVYGLKQDLRKGIVTYGEGLMGKVVQTGAIQSTNEFSKLNKPEKLLQTLGLETVVGVPLTKKDGEVEAVLFIADKDHTKRVDDIDLEILLRFAAQVSIALQTADLLERDQRWLSQLTLLQTINTHIQTIDNLDMILDAVLTGITAGFGLGFNRGALFLHEPSTNRLVGKAGIGHRNPEKTWQTWQKLDHDGPNDFKAYLESIKETGLTPMPLQLEIQKLSLPVQRQSDDLFSAVFHSQHGEYVKPEAFKKLPLLFRQIFEPTHPIVIIPLVTRNKTIGILIADKKFNQMPIGNEEIQLLHAFANTTAVVIDNTRLLQDARKGRRRLNSLYQASNQLVSSNKPEDVAQTIVELALEATTAVAVNMILIDPTNYDNQHIFASAASVNHLNSNPVRLNDYAIKIMESGVPVLLSHIDDQKDKANPILIEKNIKSAAGFGISVEENRIGVMWFYYNQPHFFDKTETNALQFYVNQAALAYESSKHITNLEKMRQAAEALSSAQTLDEVKQYVLMGAVNVLQADGAALWAYDEQRNKFILQDSVATFAREDWLAFQQDEPSPGGTADTVMSSGWIGVEDVQNEDRFAYLGDSTRNLLHSVGVKSFQGIRLKVNTESLGVLYVEYNNKRSFTDGDIKTATTYAHHVSLALKKAKLLERVQNEHRTAKIVARLTTLNNNSGDLNEVLETVAASTITALHCDAVTIYIYEQKRDKLIYPPTTRGVHFPDRVHRKPYVPKDSLVTDMLQKEENYFVDDVTSDIHFHNSRFTQEENIHSLAVVPLKIGIDKVGVIFINYRSPHRFTTDEISNLELYADQAAIAIHNAQLYEREQKRISALQAIDDAVHAISTSEDLDSIFNIITEQAITVTGATGAEARYAHLVLVDQQGNLSLRGVYPAENMDAFKPKVNSINIYQSERIGFTGRAIIEQEPILVPNTNQTEDYITLHNETNSELAVPIFLDDTVIGVINVEHPDFEAFDRMDIQALEIMAKHACVAIQKAKSHEREIRQIAALNALDTAVRAINELTDIKQILQTIAREAVRLTGIHGTVARGSYLALVKGNRVHFEATYPIQELKRVQEKLGELPLKPQKNQKIGIIGRTVLTREPQLINDVRANLDYVPFRSKTRSELAVPILHQDEVIGVIAVDHQLVEAFDDADVQALSTLAEHAAVAIRNVELYQNLESVADISRKAATSLNLSRLLNQVCQRVEISWGQPVIASIKLYDPVNNSLKFKSEWHESYNRYIDPKKKKDEYEQPLSQGICGWVASKRTPYYSADVRSKHRELDPLIMLPGTRSEMCVPILFGEEQELIGVLDIQSPEVKAFNDGNLKILKLLADQMAVAIKKAQDFEELEHTKGMVGSRTALAWMGMASNAWRHSIEGDAVNIRELAEMIEEDLKFRANGPDSNTLTVKLDQIKHLASKILAKPITPPLSSEEGCEDLIINDLVRERIYQLCEHEKYQNIDGPYLDLEQQNLVVFASSEWIRLAFDSVVDNAIDAMQDCDERILTIYTKKVEDKVHVGIQDSGRGISDDVNEQLFTAKHASKKDGHLGRGLLIVQAIVETYGGKVFVKETSGSGTTMVLSLPILDV